jgi:hypothetical protein
MARESRYLHADSLLEAIHQASQLFKAPIERLEVIGSTIHVDAGGRRLVFRATLNKTYDRVGGTPMLGGTSGGVELVSAREGIPVSALSRLLEVLRFRKSPMN